MEADFSLYQLFAQASIIVKIVMLTLLAISILSWTFIFQRAIVLRSTKKRLAEFEKQFNLGSDLNRLYDYLATKKQQGSGIEQIFRAGFREFLRLYKQEALPNVVMEGAERALRVALAKAEEELETHLPFLATVGSISVYIGLFGTVWGIMTAFQALGQIQQATLAMVAPGISEALVATALGLFAAIPAVFAYNRYTHHVQQVVRRYDTLAEEFSGILHRRLHTQPWTEEDKIEAIAPSGSK